MSRIVICLLLIGAIVPALTTSRVAGQVATVTPTGTVAATLVGTLIPTAPSTTTPTPMVTPTAATPTTTVTVAPLTPTPTPGVAPTATPTPGPPPTPTPSTQPGPTPTRTPTTSLARQLLHGAGSEFASTAGFHIDYRLATVLSNHQSEVITLVGDVSPRTQRLRLVDNTEDTTVKGRSKTTKRTVVTIVRVGNRGAIQYRGAWSCAQFGTFPTPPYFANLQSGHVLSATYAGLTKLQGNRARLVIVRTTGVSTLSQKGLIEARGPFTTKLYFALNRSTLLQEAVTVTASKATGDVTKLGMVNYSRYGEQVNMKVPACRAQANTVVLPVAVAGTLILPLTATYR